MKIKSLIPSLILLFTLSACERTPDITSPIKYQSGGISFSYPSNWKITNEINHENNHFVSIQSTGDSVFMINTYPSKESPSLEDFADFLSKNIAKEMPIGEMITDSITPMQKAGEPMWLQEKLSVKLIYKIPHIREYRSVKNDEKTSFLTSHTSLEQQKKVEPGFHLIINSLTFTD